MCELKISRYGSEQQLGNLHVTFTNFMKGFPKRVQADVYGHEIA